MTDMYVHRYEKEMDGNQFWRDIIKNTLKIVNTIFKKNQPQQKMFLNGNKSSKKFDHRKDVLSSSWILSF